MTHNDRMAICYDFDKTLSPDDMQTYTFIPSVGMESAAFFAQSNDEAIRHRMDRNLAWMKKMLDEAARTGVSLRRDAFRAMGGEVKLFPGLDRWFDSVNAYGLSRGIRVEHYVISSGLREMIEGSAIAPHLTRIYASSFLYDAAGAAVWPAQAVNYTNKTQFVFRIAKGAFDENDESVNLSTKPEDLYLPYRNMVYIGDSETDIPSMRVVQKKGGFAVGVYSPETDRRRKVYDLFLNKRVDFFAPADYRDDQPLYRIVTRMIDLASARNALDAETDALRRTVAPYAAYRDAKNAFAGANGQVPEPLQPMLEQLRSRVEGNVD